MDTGRPILKSLGLIFAVLLVAAATVIGTYSLGQGSPWDVFRRGLLFLPPIPGVVIRNPDPATATTVSDDGTMLAVATGSLMRVWRVQDGREIARYRYPGSAYCILLATDLGTVSVIANDKMHTWDAGTEKHKLAEFDIGNGYCQNFGSARFGSKYLRPLYNNSVDIRDIKSGAKIASLVGHSRPTNSAVWSDDGRSIVTASEDGTVRVWNGQTGVEMARTTPPQRYPEYGMSYAAFTPGDERIVALGLLGDSWSLWNFEERQLRPVEAAQNSFRPLADRFRAQVTGSEIRLYDIASDELLAKQAFAAQPQNIQTRRSGDIMLVQAIDGPAWLWRPFTSEMPTQLPPQPPGSLSLSPDGTSVLWVSANAGDLSARIWTRETKLFKPIEPTSSCRVRWINYIGIGDRVRGSCEGESSGVLWSSSTGRIIATY